MPSAYTDKIKDDISFKEYALNCARNFGACMDFRDEPSDFKINEIKVSDYHKNELIKSKQELSDLFTMTFSQAKRGAKKKLIQDKKEYKKMIKQKNDLKNKYIAMLIKAQSWNPPSSEHVNLKSFMISQIEESINFDCHTDYYKKPKHQDAFEFHAAKIDNAAWNIEYDKKHLKEEIESTFEKNKWINDLKKSLETK